MQGCVTNERAREFFQYESRSLTHATQLEFANHLKVLCSKGMVLNV
jgi:hypothetical protein